MKKNIKIGIFIGIIGFLFFLCFNIVIYFSAQKNIFSPKSLPQGYTTALLFGAGVRDGQLSHILQDRADTALQLFSSGTIQKILITADNSSADYDEVRPTREYLLSQGVDTGSIYLDFAGFDSYDSIYRAKEVFGGDHFVLISQRFHLPRLLFLCWGMNIDCVGVPADQRSYRGIRYNYFRESLANIKAAFSLLFHLKPRFLGDQIPLSGESNAFQYEDQPSGPLEIAQ